MLRKYRLFLLFFVVIVWFFIMMPYLLLQTAFGAKIVTRLINNYNDEYIVQIEHISYTLKKPYELIFKNIDIRSKKDNSPIISSPEIVLGLQKENVFQIHSFDYADLNGGLLTVYNHHNININSLSLNNISINYQYQQNLKIKLANVNGYFSPFSSNINQENLDSSFALNAEKLNINEDIFDAIKLKGRIQDGLILIDQFDTNYKNSSILFNAKITHNNELYLPYLELNKFNISAQNQVDKIDALLNHFDSVKIDDLVINDSNFMTSNLIINDGQLRISNISYYKKWDLAQSGVDFYASSLIFKDEYFQEPQIKWHKNENGTLIDLISATWNKGKITFDGLWKSHELLVNHLIFDGISFHLPKTWQTNLNEFLSNAPSKICVTNLLVTPSLLIDTNSAFPFQLTHLEAIGEKIEIDSKQKTFQGIFKLKAHSATVNNIELKDLLMALTSNHVHHEFKFNSYLNVGLIEGSADLSANGDISIFQISNYYVKSDLLSKWHLLENPIDVDFYNLELVRTPETNTLDGIFTKNKEKHYLVKNQHLFYEEDEPELEDTESDIELENTETQPDNFNGSENG